MNAGHAEHTVGCEQIRHQSSFTDHFAASRWDEGTCSTPLACYAEPEVRAEDAYEWTQGRVVFADRKRREPTSSIITTPDGQEFQPSAFWNGAPPVLSMTLSRSECMWSRKISDSPVLSHFIVPTDCSQYKHSHCVLFASSGCSFHRDFTSAQAVWRRHTSSLGLGLAALSLAPTA